MIDDKDGKNGAVQLFKKFHKNYFFYKNKLQVYWMTHKVIP